MYAMLRNIGLSYRVEIELQGLNVSDYNIDGYEKKAVTRKEVGQGYSLSLLMFNLLIHDVL